MILTTEVLDGSQSTLSLRDPVSLLQQLVAIPSVNPMGKDLTGPIYFEHGMTNWLIRFFQQLDIPYEVHEVSRGRCNVVARLDSPDAPSTVLLDAHQDTVPVDGMEIDPFKPVIRDGRLYGRGACDVKGGMAAMLAAFARLAQTRPSGAANVVMSCTCDEEYTATGAESLARHWLQSDLPDSLISSPPDLCIVAEPTDLHVVVAHRGVLRWKLRTLGRACHSSRPHEGRNAIYSMAQVLQVLQQYAEDLPRMSGSHPLCGTATLSVGRINGGTSVNIVPHECEIEIDRRLIPGEHPETVLADLNAYLHSRTNAEYEMLPAWIVAAPLADGDNHVWADRLLRQIAEVSGVREKQGAWYGTNASSFAAAGVPSIVYGPGSIAQAHTADEWIELTQLEQASETYYRFCTDPIEGVRGEGTGVREIQEMGSADGC
ncbi:M20 family metallopeptidase [Planctomicrobium piriforme]|uniref:Probable succinyl-diaminopimelate desuccinylase n=1 Tax=Planctomicrobium piriforme TaxID=1576369 RepID=A0A1I3IN53_9PLAN|nr:M20 family metallopeptidase [Planctomicrobium piriforme]SFI49425.1 acetylornithine deacetylase [Planctomicrobium piriforme]